MSLIVNMKKRRISEEQNISIRQKDPKTSTVRVWGWCKVARWRVWKRIVGALSGRPAPPHVQKNPKSCKSWFSFFYPFLQTSLLPTKLAVHLNKVDREKKSVFVWDSFPWIIDSCCSNCIEPPFSWVNQPLVSSADAIQTACPCLILKKNHTSFPHLLFWIGVRGHSGPSGGNRKIHWKQKPCRLFVIVGGQGQYDQCPFHGKPNLPWIDKLILHSTWPHWPLCCNLTITLTRNKNCDSRAISHPCNTSLSFFWYIKIFFHIPFHPTLSWYHKYEIGADAIFWQGLGRLGLRVGIGWAARGHWAGEG